MKMQHVSEAWFQVRIAPYVLVLGLLAFGVSLRWIEPQTGYLVLAAASGILLLAFHMMKWRTGREVFQLAAMAVTVLPLFVLMHADRPSGVSWQYMAAFISIYAAGLVAFRRRISAWS